MTEIRKTFHYIYFVSFSPTFSHAINTLFLFDSRQCLIYFYFQDTYAIISPTNKIWEKQDKKRCFVLQQIYKGLYFSHLDYLVNSFSQISYLQAYVFLYPKQGLNIYLFVFYFNGPLGMSSFQNHNYSSEQSKLAYHKKHIDLQMKQNSASFFSFFSLFSSTFNYKFYNICKTSHDLYLSL